MINISDYLSPSHEASIFKGIPIEYLDEAKAILKQKGIKYRVKYRGPRVGMDSRFKDQQQASCLRKFATSFAVYPPCVDYQVRIRIEY